ncbi:hypothetical protein PHMEG_00013181 [Phytophthora megakarya]|uniref:Uncharacterized protein n=1 Tax=Phytophthora megakarya TaxID=4795 RepID=A0A225W8J8_9STRA|nr:hypothetical protein PHMEG_00013181 [Phytophthora megakarya]
MDILRGTTLRSRERYAQHNQTTVAGAYERSDDDSDLTVFEKNVDYTSEGFQWDNVEDLLRIGFIDRSKSQTQPMQACIVSANIMASHSPLGKRKWVDEPKKKDGECFYCGGRRTAKAANGSHHRVDVKGKRLDVLPKSARGSHVKGGNKGFKKMETPIGIEIPADAELMWLIRNVEIGVVTKANATRVMAIIHHNADVGAGSVGFG